MAANNFTGATDSNWGTNTNWSTNSVPTANDGNTATFTGSSPNCTVNTSNRVCNNIDFTNYTNTITMSNAITVSGTITFGSGMHVSGAGGILMNANSTLTSNTFTWPNNMQLQGSGSATITLSGNAAVTGLLTLGTAANTLAFNATVAETITVAGGVTIASTTAIVSGTATVIASGGTVTGPTSTGSFKCPLTFSSASASVASGNFRYGTGPLTATAAATASAATLLIVASTTLTCSQMSWGAVTLNATLTLTLTQDLNIAGSFNTSTGSTVDTINGAFNVNVGTNFTLQTIGSVGGTATLRFTGTGTLSASAAGTILIPTTIDCGSGTLTVTSAIQWDLGQIKYLSGNVTTTAGAWVFPSGGGGVSIFGN